MQNKYVVISKSAQKLLFELRDIYREQGGVTYLAALAFNGRYQDHDTLAYPPSIQQSLDELYQAGYLSDVNTLAMNPQGVHYRYCQWIYWKHRVLVPVVVSFITSILVNITLYYLGLK